MVGLKLLLTAIVASAVLVGTADGGCASGGVYTGGCVTGDLNDDGATLSGDGSSPGSGGGGGGSAGGGAGSAPESPCPSGWTLSYASGTAECEPGVVRSDYDVTAPITLADIAGFPAIPPQQRMQPNGWTVAGLHTNFYALTSTHLVNGRLLGNSATVRFTPVAYHWNYGDGDTATKTTAGGTWRSLGLDEFDRTPTSHVYDRQGSYRITLSVSYRAEYRYAGDDWVPIAGTLTLPANELRITVGGAKTVLVDDDCRANPAGPGC